MGKTKQIFLYDPRTNILSETTFDVLVGITGLSKGTLFSFKSRGQIIGRLRCYLVDETVTLKQRKVWYEKEKYENETWKEIEGSGGQFLVSNYGRFQRIYKKHTGYLLPYLNKRRGDLLIKVRFKDKYTQYEIADIVAHHFVGKKIPGMVLYHKNGIKTDNYHMNLEYITNEELGRKTGFKSNAREVIQFDRFTGEVLGEYRSAREAGRKCFISYQSVMDCCNGKYKSSGGIYVFKWADEYEDGEEYDIYSSACL